MRLRGRGSNSAVAEESVVADAVGTNYIPSTDIREKHASCPNIKTIGEDNLGGSCLVKPATKSACFSAALPYRCGSDGIKVISTNVR